MSENEQNQQESNAPVYTPEQIAEMRANMKKFYEEEIPYLELQAKYEGLQTDIAVAKFKRIDAIAREAYLYASMEGPKEDPNAVKDPAPTQEPKQRTLKNS